MGSLIAKAKFSTEPDSGVVCVPTNEQRTIMTSRNEVRRFCD